MSIIDEVQPEEPKPMTAEEKHERPRQSALRTAGAGLIGNVLEWFDFAVYGYFSRQIGDHFFTPAPPQTRELLSLAVFALGFLARPLGSVILGSVGDRIGRRALLTLSIALMGAATLVIGCLPSYGTIGWAAPALLILMRAVQGFSLGGEFTGSMVYTTELSSPLIRGLVSSSTAAGTTLGFILGSLTAWLLVKFLGPADVAAWGWRVPFIGSILFCIVGWLLRRNIHESEQGEKAAELKPPVLASLLADWKPIVQTFGIVGMTNASYYLVFTFAVDQRKSLPSAVDNDFQLANTLSLVVVLFAKLVGGWLSDKVGRRKLMIALTVVMLAAVYPATLAMTRGTWPTFMAGQILMGIPIAMAFGLQGAMLVEIFPLRTRVMSMSIAYSITLALAGGSAPLVVTYMIGTLGWSPLSPAFYTMIYGVLGLAIMLPMRETNNNSLD